MRISLLAHHLFSRNTLILFPLFMAFAVSWAAAPTEVLMIGDSHSVGFFGQDLHNLVANSVNVRADSYASWGTDPAAWITGHPTNNLFRAWTSDGQKIQSGPKTPTPLLRDLVRAKNPDIVVIELGSNFVRSPADYQITSSLRLAKEATARGARCFWVGPPDFKGFMGADGKLIPVSPEKIQQTYDSLAKVAQETHCTLIDSRTMTSYPAGKGDGTHYDYVQPEGPALARHWAEGVYQQLGLQPKAPVAASVSGQSCASPADTGLPGHLLDELKQWIQKL